MDGHEIIITNKSRIEPKHKCDHEPYEYIKYEVVRKSIKNQSCISFYEIPPQKANYPYHYHLKNEETFYIISGCGILETPKGSRNIGAGDIIVCPPAEEAAHRIVNTSDTQTLVYLDFDTMNFPDVVCYPNSDKIGVITEEGRNIFFKKQTAVDYYAGE